MKDDHELAPPTPITDAPKRKAKPKPAADPLGIEALIAPVMQLFQQVKAEHDANVLGLTCHLTTDELRAALLASADRTTSRSRAAWLRAMADHLLVGARYSLSPADMAIIYCDPADVVREAEVGTPYQHVAFEELVRRQREEDAAGPAAQVVEVGPVVPSAERLRSSGEVGPLR